MQHPCSTYWLTECLQAVQMTPHWVRLCEETLVHEEGFTSAHILASVSPDRFTDAYLHRLGFTGPAIQQQLLKLHRDASAQFANSKPPAKRRKGHGVAL